MSSQQTTTPFEWIRQSFLNNRMAHAYLIVGSPRGAGRDLAQRLLQMVLCASAGERPCGHCAACGQVVERTHPDAHWLEPEGKARQVKVESLQAGLIQPFSQTPFYADGWKTGVILAADRLNETSQNALLKTLEEPLGHSLILLVTDAPQGLLPTIVSRCHRIHADPGDELSDNTWRARLLEILSMDPVGDTMDVFARAGMLNDLFEEIAAQIEQEDDDDDSGEVEQDKAKEIQAARARGRLREVQSAVFQVMQGWYRDVLFCHLGVSEKLLHHQAHIEALRRQASLLGRAGALAHVAAAEEIQGRILDRFMPSDLVIEAALMRASRA